MKEYIKSLRAEKEGINRELATLQEAKLSLEARLSDAQIVAETLRNQLGQERKHREELQKILSHHQATIDQRNESNPVPAAAAVEKKDVSLLDQSLASNKELQTL